jgi:hypothetical protein
MVTSGGTTTESEMATVMIAVLVTSEAITVKVPAFTIVNVAITVSAMETGPVTTPPVKSVVHAAPPLMFSMVKVSPTAPVKV